MAVKSRWKKSRSELTKADKTSIKAEQAAFLEKISSAQANEHQEVIFEKAKSGQGHYVIIAGPGSGKTFTSIKASTSFTGKSIYFSYNKKTEIDANERLVAIDSLMIATTAHSFGLSCLMAFNRGQCRIDDQDEKYSTLVKSYIFQQWDSFIESIQVELEDAEEDVAVMRLNAQSWSESLIHFAQVSLTKPTSEGLARLISDFDLSDIRRSSLVWSFVVLAVSYAIDAGLRQFLGPEHLVSFDDMVYYPNVISGVPVRQYDHIIVDEAQDTSRAALELMLKACHSRTQFFAVGDPRQNIYRFSGAAEDSIGQIIERLHAETLPLKIVYRCGSNIVALANQLCDEDEMLIAAGSHEGSVEVIKEYIDQLQSGDAVIGRTTKKLVQGCLRTLRTGKKAKVLGKNIGENIAAVVTRLEAQRIKRGVPSLEPDLSNFLEVLSEYKSAETKSLQQSREHPEMALSELEDKVDTCQAFFEAYISKCYDESLRTPEDSLCLFNRSAKDFKNYIRGLFSDDASGKDFIIFMTVHRSKGGEWNRVFVIGTEEFPHPKAKSAGQKQQETNLMYVAITRAIHSLYFVGEPFGCVTVPGYEPDDQKGLTIISFPAADHLEIHSADGAMVISGRETVEPSIYDAPGFEDYDPEVVDILFRDSFISVGEDEEAEFRDLKALGEMLQSEVADRVFEREILGEAVPREMILPFTGETIIVEAVQPGNELEVLTEGRVGRIAAIEVLCPACGSQCVDRALESPMITYDLVGHTVVCSSCHKACIVPLNAFSLEGNVFAREKPVSGTANHRVEKKGRTQKERKSKAGRKPKGQGVRQPMQLSLDSRVIKALNVMGVNKSALFVELLQQYEPFLDAWAELEDAEEDSDELDHDEIEDK